MAYTILLLFLLARLASSSHNQEFVFSRHLKLNGESEIGQDGSVTPINAKELDKGQIFYTLPFKFKNSSTGLVQSFSTSFVFSIGFSFPVAFGGGISFVISPSKTLPVPHFKPSQHMQLPSNSSQENMLQNIFAVELGTRLGLRNEEIYKNYVKIKSHDLVLSLETPLGYFSDKNGKLKELLLTSGVPVQVWVEYDAKEKQMNVSISPMRMPKPSRPLLSVTQDLSPFLHENMYVGISTSYMASIRSHHILGWSFKMNGKAQDFEHSQLVKFIPTFGRFPKFTNWTCMYECTFSIKIFRNCTREDKLLMGNRRLGGQIWTA